MPKRKTGARKKKEKMRERNKEIAQGSIAKLRSQDDLSKLPANMEMQCDRCERRQKNRAFCYFCGSIQRLPMCAQCGKIKCVMGGGGQGECLVRHPTGHATGMRMVGAVCDFCEAWVCHSRVCVASHACECMFRESPEEGSMPISCYECDRSVWQTGGRYFRCATCARWLCEDDHFEHQASCQYLDAENYKCISCGRHGQWSCLRCKVAFCDAHVRSKISIARANAATSNDSTHMCKKCGFPLQETKGLAISTRSHSFGRHATGGGDTSNYYNYALEAHKANQESEVQSADSDTDSDADSEEWDHGQTGAVTDAAWGSDLSDEEVADTTKTT